MIAYGQYSLPKGCVWVNIPTLYPRCARRKEESKDVNWACIRISHQKYTCWGVFDYHSENALLESWIMKKDWDVKSSLCKVGRGLKGGNFKMFVGQFVSAFMKSGHVSKELLQVMGCVQFQQRTLKGGFVWVSIKWENTLIRLLVYLFFKAALSLHRNWGLTEI